MATATTGYPWTSGETVTPEKLSNTVSNATITLSDGEVTTAKLANLAVTDAKLATGAVTGAAGGGKLAASAITGQTAIDALATGDSLLVYDLSNTALRSATITQLTAVSSPAGSVVNTVQSVKTAQQTTTATIPVDGTIPQISEGTEIHTAQITPSSASNKVLIRVTMFAANSVAERFVLALFKDSDASAITATSAVGNPQAPMTLEFLHSPATTSTITYRVRGGVENNYGTLTINGNSSSYGAIFHSNITLQEIKG
jgi:hypothetical protein